MTCYLFIRSGTYGDKGLMVQFPKEVGDNYGRFSDVTQTKGRVEENEVLK